MNNIVQKYIIDTKKRLKQYASIILKSKYNAAIMDVLLDTYIDSRYYNFYKKSTNRVFYRRIYEELVDKSLELNKEFDEEIDKVDAALSLFKYIFYFDFVRHNLPIDDVIKKVQDMRVNELNLRSAVDDNFINEFSIKLKEDIRNIERVLHAYDSEDFYIELKKISPKDNFYLTELKFDFKFPDVFSIDSIIETFNTGVIAEDKLFVEYPMIAVDVLNDLIECNFEKKYVVDFTVELLSKKKKLDQLLEILNNAAVQDKVFFRISYMGFVNSKDEIFKLIKRGFKFIIQTHANMGQLNETELNLLKIFNTIIVDTNDINKKKYKNKQIIII